MFETNKKTWLPLFLALIALSLLVPNQPLQIYSFHQLSPVPPPYTPALLTFNITKYVIILGDSNWVNAVTPLAEWKTYKGIPTEIYTTDYIYQNYAGEDNASKIRNFLKDLYRSKGIQWVLLVGDVDKVPIRNFTIGTNKVPSDYYYAALDGSFDNDMDGEYGEPGEIDWMPELYVGRIPVSTTDELNVFINKTLTYEKYLYMHNTEWLNKFVLAGGEINSLQDIQGWRAKLASVGSIPLPPLEMILLAYDTKRNFSNLTSFIEIVEGGASIVDICSHGSPTALYCSSHLPIFLNSASAARLSNGPRLPLFFISACEAGRIDYSSDSIAEALLKNPCGGAIAVIAPTRITFGGDTIDDAADTFLDHLFFKLFFSSSPPFTHRPGYALYESKKEFYLTHRSLVERDVNRAQLFVEYILLGDPEVPICCGPMRDLKISVEGNLAPGKRAIIKVSDGSSVVSGALVCLQGRDYYRVYLTDKNGEIHFPCPEQGVYVVTVTKEGFAPAQTSIVVGTPIRILVDEYHHESSHYMEFWNNTSKLRAILNASLLYFQALYDSQVTPEVLEGFHILVIYCPSRNYTESEVSAILDFVMSGGGLLLIGENDPDSLEYLNILSSLFNVSFSICSKTGFTTARCIKSPQTFRAKEVLLKDHGKIDGGRPIIVAQESIIVGSCINWGRGRVAFLSDLDFLKDDVILEKDNVQLFKSLCKWLANSPTPPQFNITLPTKVEKGKTVSLNVTATHPYDIVSLTIMVVTDRENFTNTSLGNVASLQFDTLKLRDDRVLIYAVAVTGNGETYMSDVVSLLITEHKLVLELPLIITQRNIWLPPVFLSMFTLSLIMLSFLQRKSSSSN
ncbi:MAG: C25 family cysteine peptidase [Candidatus Jordarchaeales archaeon]